jgi:DNA-binding winged helix-turn-helix (wHTH) protein/Tol biopolymer transport system component
MNLTTSATGRVFRFAQFELSERERELRRKGVRVKLQEQPFRVLTELLANAGRIVTREELQQKLWPADTFVDFDVGLNTAIRKIRQALGDDADRPQFIETVAKRGYRFLVSVSQASTLASEPSAPVEIAERKPTTHHHRRWYAALIVATALITGDLWWITRPNPHPAVEKRITANPVEAPIRAAVISPDGKYVAYADPTGAYLRLVASGETHPLPLPKDFIALPSSWFPDSTHLLVTSRVRGEQKASVWNISILGSSPQILVDDAESGSVSPDGTEIAFFRRTFVSVLQREGGAVRTAGQLWIMGANGDNPHIFAGPTDLAGAASLGTQITAVSWAPNSKRIAYIERHTNFATAVTGDTYQLRTRDTNRGEPQTILSDHRLASDALSWAPDGRLLYALRTDPNNDLGDYGTWALRVDPSTGEAKGKPQPVSEGLGWIGGLNTTADGKYLVLWRGNTRSQVFISEFNKSAHRLTAPRRLTLDENENLPTAWMPDSKSVLFLSNRNGPWKLFRQDLGQPTADVMIGARNMETTLPRLNADGSQILFVDVPKPDDPSVPIRLMSIPLSGGGPRLIRQNRGLSNFACARAPSTVCVVNDFLGATSTFTTFELQSGQGREITRFDGWPNYGLSPNGSLLAVVTDEHRGRLQFLALDTGATRDVIVKDWPVLRGADWAPDGKSLLIGSLTPAGTSVILDVDLEGTAHVLLESDPHTQFAWAIPSPDGRYAALNVSTGENNVWMVQNF